MVIVESVAKVMALSKDVAMEDVAKDDAAMEMPEGQYRCGQ